VKLPLALAELGLIDEYEFVVQPRLAGHGPTLLAGLSTYIDLKLVSRLEFGSGAVAMRYEPGRLPSVGALPQTVQWVKVRNDAGLVGWTPVDENGADMDACTRSGLIGEERPAPGRRVRSLSVSLECVGHREIPVRGRARHLTRDTPRSPTSLRP